MTDQTGTQEIRGKPAGIVDSLLGNSEDGIETDAAGDKVKEVVPSDD